MVRTAFKLAALLAVVIISAIIPEWFVHADVLTHRQSGVINGVTSTLVALWMFPFARPWEG